MMVWYCCPLKVKVVHHCNTGTFFIFHSDLDNRLSTTHFYYVADFPLDIPVPQLLVSFDTATQFILEVQLHNSKLTPL
jgi:hypothetical protein